MMPAVRMVQRNALVYRRVWRGSVFSSFLQPTLFLAAMGLGVGAMVDAGRAVLPDNASYAEFLAPGLLAAAAMQVSGFESTYPVLGKMMWFRNYEAIAATPMRASDLVLGELAWMALRLTTIATAFVLVMTAFGIPRSPLVILAIPAAVLTGLAFAAPIMAYAATLKHAKTFNVLFRFVITPLFLFSGVFFPVGRLPDPFERGAWFTPLFHGVQLVRGLTLDSVPTAWPIHVAYLTMLVAAGAAMAQRTFRRRLYS
ncbi:MAG TPA: ABC transporter permease [Vicinamibacterales bacterium]